MQDILAQLEQAQASLTEALASKTALDTLLAERDNDISQARKAVSEANAAKASLEASLADKDIELSNLKASLEALKAEQRTAQERAIELVAAQGVPTVKVDVKAQESVKMTRQEAVTKFASIKDPNERARFFAANKALIFDKE
jgi:chromosome segregation ATPase